MIIRVIIPTYNRPEELSRVVTMLRYEEFVTPYVDLDIHVYDDGSNPTAKTDATMHKMMHHGKQRHWQLVHRALRDASRADDWRYLIWLPDDVMPVEGFLALAIRQYMAIDDEKKIAYSLLVDERAGSLQWVQAHPVRIWYGELEVWRQYWLDMTFLAPRKFGEVLDWGLKAVPLTFWKNTALPRRSSGVGRQISKRLFKMGYNVYSPVETLVIHDGSAPSRMHPDSPKRPNAK